jgi:hypothetical protein
MMHQYQPFLDQHQYQPLSSAIEELEIALAFSWQVRKTGP